MHRYKILGEGINLHNAGFLSGLPLMAVLVCGCQAWLPEESIQQSSKVERSIDAGIVFADRSGYFCIPIETLGLTPTEDIQGVTSSCNCILPSIVIFNNDQGQKCLALLLKYSPDSTAGSIGTKAVRLSVILTLNLKDGGSLQCNVKLLNASTCQESLDK